MRTKLILVEGTWGSGKTTTARYIKELLDQRNMNSLLFTEGTLNHPVDPEHVACYTPVEYGHLLQTFQESSELLKSMTFISNGNYFIPYLKMKLEHGEGMTDSLFNYLKSFDVYDGNLSVEKHCEVIMNFWTEFAKRQLQREEIMILECCFLQNPVIALLARYHAEKDQIIQHVMRLANVIKELRPVVVYLHPKSIAKTLDRAINERSDEWLEAVQNYCLGQGYGENREVQGISGLVQFLEERDSIEQEILKRANLIVERIDTLHTEKDYFHNKIKSFFDTNLLMP
jgi:hypothetical protein